jgi:hypothetical protein
MNFANSYEVDIIFLNLNLTIQANSYEVDISNGSWTNTFVPRTQIHDTISTLYANLMDGSWILQTWLQINIEHA